MDSPFGVDPFRLRLTRDQARLTQEQAGSLCGASKASWSKWERGEGQPSVAQLQQYAAGIGVEIEALLRGGE